MAYAARKVPQPRLISDINTTPLIDVMLVLLIMLILTIPIATQSLEVDLPPPGKAILQPDRVINKVVVTTDGRILWNGTAMDQRQLMGELAAAAALKPQPLIQFEPEAQASYNLSAEVIRSIKFSGAKKFAFIGNERYRNFGKQDFNPLR